MEGVIVWWYMYVWTYMYIYVHIYIFCLAVASVMLQKICFKSLARFVYKVDASNIVTMRIWFVCIKRKDTKLSLN